MPRETPDAMSETTEIVTVDATSTTTPTPTTTAPTKDEPLGDAGKLALMKERERRDEFEKRAKAAETELAKINAAKATADEDAAKRNGEFERLYQAEIAKRESTEKELATERRTFLVNKVGLRHKLPDDVIELLKGDTEDEVDAHAKTLAKHFGVRHAPDTEGGAGSRAGARATQQPTAIKTTEPGRLPDGTQKVAWPT